MKRTLFLIFLLLCGACFAATTFDGFGVWHAVESTVINAEQTVNYGPLNVTGRDAEINILAYGVTAGDSLKLTITIYGMMGYTPADTVHAVQLKTTSVATTGKTVALCDTLKGESLYPYLWGKVTNNHASSSATVDLWLYAQPREFNYVKVR